MADTQSTIGFNVAMEIHLTDTAGAWFVEIVSKSGQAMECGSCMILMSFFFQGRGRKRSAQESRWARKGYKRQPLPLKSKLASEASEAGVTV